MRHFLLLVGCLAACDDGASKASAVTDTGPRDPDVSLADAEVSEDQGTADDVPLLIDPDASATCNDGQTRCADDSTLETCAAGAWSPSVCPEDTRCARDACVCPPGEAVGCDGPFRRRVCGPDGILSLACPVDQWCDAGQCAPAACGVDDACHSDTRCVDGVCTAFPDPPADGTFNACRLPLEVGDFAPEVQCRWRSGDVSMQPIVIDLDRDGTPEVVFVSSGRLTAIRGDDCTEVARTAQGSLYSGESSIAAGDVDADGRNEVVVMGVGGVTVFDETLQTIEWIAASPVLALATAPVIADLDADGRPEVIVGATAFNGEDGSVHGRAVEPPGHGFGPIPVVADVDQDGLQEVLYGNRIFDAQMQDITPDAMRRLPPGHVAVAEFDAESPGPELAVVTGRTQVRVQRLDGTVIFGPYAVPDSMWAGGAPNVADFDGDGRPEIGTAGSTLYAVFDLECVGEPLPEGCEAEGIRWTRTVRDTSSGSTGSTTFDFEGDGKVEVVYNDECFLRVFDGTTGEVRLAIANTTGTLIEAPIVADADGDYNAEIVVGSDTGFPCNQPDESTGTPSAQTAGITIVRDVRDRWVHSRPIFNQNAYSITNVESDGSIPAVPEANWLKYNSFRENAAPDDKALEAPDLTVDAEVEVERSGCGEVELTFTVHNRGSQPVARGLPVLVLDGPADLGGRIVCELETTTRIEAGDAEEMSCAWPDAPDEGGVLYVYADAVLEGGVLVDRNAECLEGNGWTVLYVPGC